MADRSHRIADDARHAAARPKAYATQPAARTSEASHIGESFNWVDNVSIGFTDQMLATLFAFPFEERRKLTSWSGMATWQPMPGAVVEPEDEKQAILRECLNYFLRLW